MFKFIYQQSRFFSIVNYNNFKPTTCNASWHVNCLDLSQAFVDILVFFTRESSCCF